MPILSNPFFLAGLATVAALLGARYFQKRSPLTSFVVQLLAFVILTGLMLADGIVPYHAGSLAGSEHRRLIVAIFQIVWWLSGARLAIGFLRAFSVLGHRFHQAQIVHDLLAALIYFAAVFAIIAYVFGLPVQGLLATSGALAIIIGLALQSSLSDVFSGIVLNIERPYKVGNWIRLDDDIEGTVMETNWRATHIMTGTHDVAIIPNSVIAKSKLVNCSSPTEVHGTHVRIKLASSLSPERLRTLLREVLLSSTHVLQSPEPSVTVKDVSAEMVELELTYSVADVSASSRAQNEIFDRAYRAISSVGGEFAPRLASLPRQAVQEQTDEPGVPARLLAGLSLFSSLTADERNALAAQMQRKDYKPSDVVVKDGSILQSLFVISDGVLVVTAQEGNDRRECGRLAPGEFFGEFGLLNEESSHTEITALTRAVIYELSKDALAPLFKAHPRMVERLSERLASRQLALTAGATHDRGGEYNEETIAHRIAGGLRRLFSLHA